MAHLLTSPTCGRTVAELPAISSGMGPFADRPLLVAQIKKLPTTGPGTQTAVSDSVDEPGAWTGADDWHGMIKMAAYRPGFTILRQSAVAD